MADVCVIDGGYIGLSAALHLAERGYRVVMVEENRIGCGASGHNGGQIVTDFSGDLAPLERRHGFDHASRHRRLAGRPRRCCAR
ncbi:MAG: gamma-glutamylputrescine oxidase [Rhodospirillaceae bacterium]|nr:MAG: gamma-glutamylputrescine oxidase [Rhodospirillaceae bacterium]